MKVQSIESRVRSALLRDGLDRLIAGRAAAVAARELHGARQRLIAMAVEAGASKRCIGRALGMSHVQVGRIAKEAVVHRPAPDVPPDRPTIGPRIDRQDATP